MCNLITKLQKRACLINWVFDVCGVLIHVKVKAKILDVLALAASNTAAGILKIY